MSTELKSYGTSAQDFLTRSEKRVGTTGTIAVLCAALFVLYKALPYINDFLDQAISATMKTFALAGLAVVAVFVVMLLMDKRTWTEIWHIQHAFTRMLSRALMKRDPFGRMRAFANEYLQEQWEKFNNAAVTIEQQLNQKGKAIAKMDGELGEANDIVAALKKRHYLDGKWDTLENQNTFRLTSQKIVFLENSLAKLRKDEGRLQMLVRIIDKWRSNFHFEIETTRMTADFLEQDYVQANATANALEAASSAFGGGDMATADKEVRAYIENLTSGRIARADVLMKQIPELTAIGDLKGDVAEDEIMRRLTEFERAADQAMFEVQQSQTAITSGDANKIVQVVLAPAKEKVPARRYLDNK